MSTKHGSREVCLLSNNDCWNKRNDYCVPISPPEEGKHSRRKTSHEGDGEYSTLTNSPLVNNDYDLNIIVN